MSEVDVFECLAHSKILGPVVEISSPKLRNMSHYKLHILLNIFINIMLDHRMVIL